MTAQCCCLEIVRNQRCLLQLSAFCLVASEAYESRRRTIVSLLVSLEEGGAYPYAPVHVQGSDLPLWLLAKKSGLRCRDQRLS